MTVLPWSQIAHENRALRLDSQYFSKEALAADALVRRLDHETIKAMCSSVQSFGAYALTNDYEYQESGIPFLRCLNIKDGFVDFSSCLFIDEQANKLLSKSEIRAGMVLMTMSGTVGNATVSLPDWKYPVNSNQDVAKLTPYPDRSPLLIASYLNSRVGASFLRRLPVGSVQQHVFLWQIEQIPVPIFSSQFRDAVSGAALEAYRQHRLALDLLAQAEQTLLQELGLANWRPPELLTYQSRAKDVFSAGRIDAQYFNPAKEKVLDTLAKMPGKLLHERVSSIRSIFDPKKKHTPFQARNYDLPDALQPVLDDSKAANWSNEAGSTKKMFKPGDVVISRLRAYLREIAIVRTSPKTQAMGSTEFIVLRPPKADGITAETLWAFLRSAPVQTVLKWCVDGSQHPRFSENDLLNIPVPDAVVAASPKVDSVFRAAIAARNRAYELLDCAKRAVEIAIEESEAAALKYLKGK